MLKNRLIVCAALFILAAAWMPEAKAAGKQAVPAVFMMKTIEGDDISIPNKGRKTILHFWTSWCPPCKKELPQFQTYYENHHSDQVSLVTVNLVNAEQNKQAVQNFINQHHLTFPIVLDSRGELMKEYRIITIPTSFLLNEKGEIEKTVVGPMTAAQLKKWSEQ
ncbi:TlpA family protein disulfide reductase [Bacillus sp. ISL-51]|uniref:endospore biogenesis thiol-disulfide oxidoreductase StoA n=1 Tax=Bacteria TaxID=2 RepID=UPI001BE6C24F|nr:MULTISPECIES: endospore biogenesis thiol-disulfide oxidoreductase StoA [Bacteria]MBT2573594.1 TlpA family protein disulfide reductase [Bacillus sp. ISL-51]MBT2633858.1 TlpA family protein disulfide reductase [Bacillus sp. ISL-26]MBT2712553.1 TlpA family protein disulfide reductase [Pseudomonas sp. ISL-88]